MAKAQLVGWNRLLRIPADLPTTPFRLTGINRHGNCRVTAAIRAPLARCENLELVQQPAADDAVLAHLPKTALHLHNTPVTDKGLVRFDGSAALVRLNIGATKATGAGLSRFTGCTGLTHLLGVFHSPDG